MKSFADRWYYSGQVLAVNLSIAMLSNNGAKILSVLPIPCQQPWSR